MNSKKNIVFLGMMGSGKSSIGSLISKELNLVFFDTDQIIEKKLNQIDFPAPKKVLEKIVPNEKFKIVK